MERIEESINTITRILKTNKSRHIVGGVLLSMSLFFGGLAVTVLTMKKEENEENE